MSHYLKLLVPRFFRPPVGSAPEKGQLRLGLHAILARYDRCKPLLAAQADLVCSSSQMVRRPKAKKACVAKTGGNESVTYGIIRDLADRLAIVQPDSPGGQLSAG